MWNKSAQERSNRRTFLRKSATYGTIVAGITLGTRGVIAGGVSTDDNVTSPGGGGDNQWGQNSVFHEYLTPDVRIDHHLGSAIQQVEADPGGSHEFRVAGDFCSLQGEGVANFGPWYQDIVLENESPDGLSIFTSANSAEIAMNPQPINTDDGSFASAFSATTGALSLAASVAGASTGGLALGAASLVSGMYALLDAGDTSSPGLYKWHAGIGLPDTPGEKAPRGGHHANFGVNEHGGGSIKITSKINNGVGNATNQWRLSFNDGLNAVNEL